MSSTFFSFILFSLIQSFFCPSADCQEPWKPFSLSVSQLNDLNSQTSSSTLSLQEVEKWDEIANQLMIRYPPADGDRARLTAYLYNAQKAFADASFASSGRYAGTFDPISQHIIQLFFTNYETKEEPNANRDPFSNELALAIIKKIDSRFDQEQSAIQPLTISEKKNTWQGKVPYTGITIPNMQPWTISLKDYLAPPPPSAANAVFWNDQLAQVKESMERATTEQKQKILFWAGMSPPGSGDFIQVATNYMNDHNLPLNTQLEVRAQLASAMFDSLIAVFASKYKYMVKRPDMQDPALKPYIRNPNHPSYPAGHSITSAAAANVLTRAFPENKNEWERLAEACGLSRIAAGVHYPIDHLAGKDLGNKIGRHSDSDTLQQRQTSNLTD